MPRIVLQDLVKSYEGPSPARALRGVSLVIEQGEFIAIEGPSGAGKSTLLNMLALLDSPTSGTIHVDDTQPERLTAKRLAQLRSRTFGFIFQGFHLMESRSVLENVMLAFTYRSVPHRAQIDAAHRALTHVGLDDRADELVRNLSGGQRQRVAIARAIAADAPVLVADEPTGNLDSENSAVIIGLLEDIARTGRTVIIVTHSPDVARAAERRIVIRDGLVASDTRTPAVTARPVPLADDAPTQPIPLISPHAPTQRAGTDSRLALPDLIRDAWASIMSRAGRSIALVLAVALGVGLAVTTLGLSDAARTQVSSAFDAQRNRHVDARLTAPDAPITDYADRASTLAGVDTAGARTTEHDAGIAYHQALAPAETPLSGVTDHYLDAIGATVSWTGTHRHLDQGTTLIGASLARSMSLGPVFAEPTIQVNGQNLTVIGIITKADRDPELLRSVVVDDRFPVTPRPLNSGPGNSETLVHILAAPGAAQQIGRQLPLQLQPTNPTSVSVQAPPDPASQRTQIEATVRSSLLALSAVSILAAVISLVNSMSVSVLERSREFGLRRALGAQPKHLRRLVLLEAFIIGIAGGITGLFLGLLGVLSVCIARGWSPVFNPALGPLAITAGITVGMLAGAVAAWRASRIQPVEALRL